MSARRAEWATVAAVTALAVLAWALIPTYPNYDAYYHLVWGRELMAGHAPGFEAYSAPTPHPLYVAVCALLSLTGEGADRLLVLATVLSHVGFTWAVYRLGAAIWDRRAGLMAALLAGSSFALLLYTARAYVDIPYLALVLWAGALEAERPRRGRAVFVLLALAGLLRPEAWLLSLLYLLYMWHSRRTGSRPQQAAGTLEHVAWFVAPPLIWCLTDLVVTGDPLWSLHGTSALAEALGRDRGIADALSEGLRFIAGTAREPVAIAAVAGIAVAWRRGDGRALHVPLALFGAGVAAFLLTSGIGLSVLPRYLTVPAVMLCLPAGYLVTRGRAIFALAVVAGVAFLIVRADVLGRLTTELRFIPETRDDLRALVREPAVREARRCGPVALPNYRLVPDLLWYEGAHDRAVVDRPRSAVIARSDPNAAEFVPGVVIVYTSEKLIDRYGKADGASLRTNHAPVGFTRLAGRGGFALYERCR